MVRLKKSGLEFELSCWLESISLSVFVDEPNRLSLFGHSPFEARIDDVQVLEHKEGEIAL